MVIIFTANISQLANMDWPEKISKMTPPPPPSKSSSVVCCQKIKLCYRYMFTIG